MPEFRPVGVLKFGMQTFTLIVWLWVGPRFEDTSMENLNRSGCVEQAIAIEAHPAQQLWTSRPIRCVIELLSLVSCYFNSGRGGTCAHV